VLTPYTHIQADKIDTFTGVSSVFHQLKTYSLTLFTVLLLLNVRTPAQAETGGEDFSITAKDGTELTLIRYPAKGEHLIIWIAPGYGIHERSTQTARRLAAKGIEVWQIDLAEALFLTNSTEQMRSFTGHYVSDLIEEAHKQTHKKILLAARAYGVIPLLRGARLWQTHQSGRLTESYLKGAILFSPDMYKTIPALGLEPEYVPITYATNIPLMIFQDGKRGNRDYINRLIDSLMIGGSQPMLKILPGVSGLFFSNDDSPETRKAIRQIPRDIISAIKLLEKFPSPLTPAPLTASFKPVGSGLDSGLRAFKGKFLPYAIDLPSSSGKHYQRKDYRGQITIINFWATWCSPCIKEIPSLNRLRKKMQDVPFELISINFSEKNKTIHKFMKEVDVEFPVLLDEEGKQAVKWKVVTLPSTFVIGPDGKIHYGVNAAIHWDNPGVITELKKLLPNAAP